jgi:hypothetical protein
MRTVGGKVDLQMVWCAMRIGDRVLLLRLNEPPDSDQYLAKRLQKPLCGKRGTERRKNAAANTRASSIIVTAKAKEAKVVVTEAAEAAVVPARRFGDE